ncbi:unnamed protein product [Protopolystoma xenopodis]|uniref:Uncharacterized protein n=1 Tax=Protopolystoma xenopodis TaxID=117903 RepID=A0A448WMQ7_9PLAT|nr:unnamed protein product [Protopolystoma xenopodis]
MLPIIHPPVTIVTSHSSISFNSITNADTICCDAEADTSLICLKSDVTAEISNCNWHERRHSLNPDAPSFVPTTDRFGSIFKSNSTFLSSEEAGTVWKMCM